MPEGYTHVRTANAAAAKAGFVPQYPAVFAQGANGPDNFFFFEAWRKKKKRSYNLPGLGSTMHRNSTGRFLVSLLLHAETQAQKEYLLGFLCHYATDSVMHPYVAAVQQPGQVYAVPGGHGYFEIGLDSYLHDRDGLGKKVPVDDCSPAVEGGALAQICVQLQQSVQDVYGVKPSVEAIADSFHYTRMIRRLFATRDPLRRAVLSLAEGSLGGKGFLTGHLTPARLKGILPGEKRKLPVPWVDPYTGQNRTEDLNALLTESEDRSARLIRATLDFFEEKCSAQELADILGDNSYETGQPALPLPKKRKPW